MPGPEAYRRGSSGFKFWGGVSIATSESTTATSYAIGNLTTPDRVQNVVLPANGLIIIGYQAIWQNTVASNGRAAIFIGSNQAKVGLSSAGGAPAVQEATGNANVNIDSILQTSGGGLLSGGSVTVNDTEVTTGQVVGSNNASFAGGSVQIFAAAGTYDVSIQFKNNAAGTTTVSKRHLWVATIG